MTIGPEPEPDPEQRFAARLTDYWQRCGSPSMRRLEGLTEALGRPQRRSSISDKLTGRTHADWPFVAAFVTACAQHAGLPPDPDPWREPHLAMLTGRGRRLSDQRRATAADQEAAAVHGVRVATPGWPRQVGLIPQPADHFQPRSAGADLAEALDRGGTAGPQVLSGLGGVGKTQLAAHYAHRRLQARDVDLLVWVTAASRRQILDRYLEAATGLGLADRGDPDRVDPEQVAQRLLAWLAGTDRRWLIVLDDLVHPGDLRGLWPPAAPGGATVVTTRRRDAALHRTGRTLVDVGLFTPAEAHAYLEAKLGPAGGPAGDLDGLAADLGRLPLALAQAATYLLDRELDCAGYRARFADRKRTLAQLVPEDDSLPDDHATTVAVTWSLSIEVADGLRPAGLARPLLQLASLLSPDDIPAVLFRTDEIGAWAGTAGTPVPVEDVQDGLRNLHRLNLATVSGDTVRVHALVQRATREAAQRDGADPDAWRRLVHAAADATVAVGNLAWGQPRLTERLWACVRALVRHGGAALWEPDGHPVLYGFGDSLGHAGQVRAATEYFRELIGTAVEQLGPDHEDTLLTRSRHARWLAESGQLREAAAELGRVVADRTRLWGEDHPGNLVDLANRATQLGDAGDAATALAEFTRLVRRRTALLGPDDRETLITRGNQARWRGETGDRPGAVRALAELVPLFARAFGPEHPRTVQACVELAAWRGELDPAAGAADFARLLPVLARVRGPYDAATLSARRNLAVLSGRTGSRDQAIGALTELIADYQRHFEPDHPDALRARTDLAERLLVDRRDAAAQHLLSGLLADQLRVLGPDHPDTVRTTGALSVAQERLLSLLARRLGATFASGRSVSTTLEQVTGDVGLQVDWVRQALTALVAAGRLQAVRGSRTGGDPAGVDLLTIAGHARFQLVAIG